MSRAAYIEIHLIRDGLPETEKRLLNVMTGVKEVSIVSENSLLYKRGIRSAIEISEGTFYSIVEYEELKKAIAIVSDEGGILDVSEYMTVKYSGHKFSPWQNRRE